MRPARCFINSAGVVLLGCAIALLIANWATADYALPRDPVLQIPIRSLFWIVGGLAAVVALICLFGERIVVQTSWVAWFSSTVAVYAAGFLWSGARSSGVLWGSLSITFAVPNRTIDILLKITFASLLAGSYWLLFWIWWRVRHGLPTDKIFLKMSCPSCGGRVKFAVQNLGQQIPCPHCQAATVLRKADESLKISCYFCKGHIEFPAYSLGQKMQCPHCKMDITLKLPGLTPASTSAV